MSDGSRHALWYILESTYGATPATPAWKALRHTGTTLGLSKQANQSNELRSDRQISTFRQGANQVGGDIPVEASYSSFDDMLEAVLCGTWNADTPGLGTDQLKVGTTRRSFSFMRHFTDQGAGDKPYHVFTGAEVNSLSLEVTANAIVTASFGYIGKGQDAPSDTAPAGSTYGSVPTTEVFDSFSGTINEGGSAIAVVTALTLELQNGIAPRFVVGSKDTIRPSIARSNVTGNVTAFFENAALLEKFINEQSSSMDFELIDLDGNSLKFYVPKLWYTGGQPDVGGEGPITLAMPFQAVLEDVTTNTNFYVERTPI